MRTLTVIAALLLFCGAAHVGGLPIIRGTATISDGYTIWLGPVSARLVGIDAPEAPEVGRQCTSADGHTLWPLRILAVLEGHFGAEDCSPADARPLARELKAAHRALSRRDLARIELDR
jgi:hypothetical protein